jgi:hypothetical protein
MMAWPVPLVKRPRAERQRSHQSAATRCGCVDSTRPGSSTHIPSIDSSLWEG